MGREKAEIPKRAVLTFRPLTAIVSLSEILAAEITGEHRELAEMIGDHLPFRYHWAL